LRNGVWWEENGLPAGSDHLGGVLEAGVCHLCAGQHARNFVGAGAVVGARDLSRLQARLRRLSTYSRKARFMRVW